MTVYGIDVPIKNAPVLDPGFIPIGAFNAAFLKTANKPVGVAVERADGQMASVHTFIHGTEDRREADHYYIERLVKTLLWMKGGFRIYVSGDEDAVEYLRTVYCAKGQQISKYNKLLKSSDAVKIVVVDDLE